MASDPSPLVSFCLLAYRQERFVNEALDGVLGQTYTPLEIVLSDDCSPDATYDIMARRAAAYRGPARIILNRNPTNLGIARHAMRLHELGTGTLFVVSASDDRSLPNRVAAIVDAYRASAALARGFCSLVRTIDENGRGLWYDGNNLQANPVYDLMYYADGRRCHFGASGAWHRDVFDRFGPIAPDVWYEDTIIGFRACLLGGMVYIPQPLLDYRVHGANAFTRAGGSMNAAQRRRHETNCLHRWAATKRQQLADLDAFLPQAAQNSATPEHQAARTALLASLAAIETELHLLTLPTLQRCLALARAHRSAQIPTRQAIWFLLAHVAPGPVHGLALLLRDARTHRRQRHLLAHLPPAASRS
jgi:GT2 family glycosyltransferase